ncbi:MAG: phosphoribosylanthranilate isomerase [Pseudomonadota bacterium]|nr:phosphoribosylanthranilate isomerase [Pseudomonadota bacterium]
MGLSVKICGVTNSNIISSAVEGKAKFVGFIFYPPSPRCINPDYAAMLAAPFKRKIYTVGVFVNPKNDLLDKVFNHIKLDFVQLHGEESVNRTLEIKVRTGAGIIKAIPLSNASDLEKVKEYRLLVDWILFDAKPPKNNISPLPGGNAVSFDWKLLSKGSDLGAGVPWFLSGGLNIDNLSDAVSISRAQAVDVSSGVELSYGKKDPELVREFLKLSARL